MASGHNGLYFFKRLGTLATLVDRSQVGTYKMCFHYNLITSNFTTKLVLLLKKWDRERLSTIRKIGRAHPCVCPMTPLLTLE